MSYVDDQECFKLFNRYIKRTCRLTFERDPIPPTQILLKHVLDSSEPLLGADLMSPLRIAVLLISRPDAIGTDHWESQTQYPTVWTGIQTALLCTIKMTSGHWK